MSKLVTLGIQIAFVVRVCLGANRDLIDNLQAISFKAHDFLRVVGKQADLANPEMVEDLCADTIVAKV